jgi:hypothetical protein
MDLWEREWSGKLTPIERSEATDAIIEARGILSNR